MIGYMMPIEWNVNRGRRYKYVVYESVLDGKPYLHVIDPNDYINFGEKGHALRIASRVVPKGTSWSFFETLPGDKTYRAAWRLSDDGTSIIVDEEEARNIAERLALLALKDLMDSRELTDQERVECERSRQLIEHTESRRKLEQIRRFFANAGKRVSD